MIDRFAYTVSAFVNSYLSLRLEDPSIGINQNLAQGLSVLALAFAVMCVVALINTMRGAGPAS